MPEMSAAANNTNNADRVTGRSFGGWATEDAMYETMAREQEDMEYGRLVLEDAQLHHFM